MGNCTMAGQTCCIDDIKASDVSESKLISRELFLKIAGNTTRNQALYNFFVESMVDANITTVFQAAAYLSQLLGESKYFKSIESLQIENDYDARLGNNQVKFFLNNFLFFNSNLYGYLNIKVRRWNKVSRQRIYFTKRQNEL